MLCFGEERGCVGFASCMLLLVTTPKNGKVTPRVLAWQWPFATSGPAPWLKIFLEINGGGVISKIVFRKGLNKKIPSIQS